EGSHSLLGTAWRPDISRRQSPYEAERFLGMDDCGDSAGLSRRDFSGGSLHSSQDDEIVSEGRVYPVVHLLYLAPHKVGEHCVPLRNLSKRNEVFLLRGNFYEHAGHFAV